MIGSYLAPKRQISVHFCGMFIKNSIFYWYVISFLSEAVKASLYYFFENWLMKLKCPNLKGTMTQ
jgi:hypothetical protein